MERLTYNDDGCWQVHGADQNLCKQVCEEYSNCKSCPIGRAIDRLAEYEDTGLTVERAAELGKADSEGRVLQYAPGDTVYDRFGRPWLILSVITRAYHDGPRHVYHRYHCGHSGTDDYCVMDSDEILTHEEAEKVLEAENHA